MSNCPNSMSARKNATSARPFFKRLLLWALSLPDNLRDGLTAQEVAEAAWLQDDAVGATAQAEHLLELLIQNGFPVRNGKEITRRRRSCAVYSYETSAMQAQPGKFFAPLKKKYLQDIQAAGRKVGRVAVLGVDHDNARRRRRSWASTAAYFTAFAPPDQRRLRSGRTMSQPKYTFPHRSGGLDASSSPSRLRRRSRGLRPMARRVWG